MELKKNFKKFCLAGQDPGYSLSPEIHNFVFKRDNINAIYEIANIQSNRINETVLSSLISNYRGINVTIPFKRAFGALIKQCDEVSELTGSVNTIDIRDDGVVSGYNTDVTGIRKGFLDIIARKMLLPSRMILLGGGGAARSMIYAFLKAHVNIKSENAREIIVFLRDPTRGRELEDIAGDVLFSFGDRRFKASLRVFKWDDAKISESLRYGGGIIVNATPRGMLNCEDSVAFDFEMNGIDGEGVVALDMTYNPSVTRFLETALNAGSMAIGGLGMLVYQALASLEIWFDRAFEMRGIFEHLESMDFQWFK
jgi:shikimate dehydrogenase